MPKQKKVLEENYSYFLTCLFVIFILFVAALNIYSHLRSEETEVLGTEKDTATLEEELKYWENFVSEHPTYRDAWLEIAKVSEELGNYDYAIGAVNSAKAIDPNSPKVIGVEKKLGI